MKSLSFNEKLMGAPENGILWLTCRRRKKFKNAKMTRDEFISYRENEGLVLIGYISKQIAVFKNKDGSEFEVRILDDDYLQVGKIKLPQDNRLINK